MTLQEYFRLPASKRLNYNQIAEQLTSQGHSITPMTIGNWMKADKIPSIWSIHIENILNKSLKDNFCDKCSITLPDNKVSSHG